MSVLIKVGNFLERMRNARRPDKRSLVIEQVRGRMLPWFKQCVVVATPAVAGLRDDDLCETTVIAFFHPAGMPSPIDGQPLAADRIDVFEPQRHEHAMQLLRDRGVFGETGEGWGSDLVRQLCQQRHEKSWLLVAFNFGDSHASVRQFERNAIAA